MKHIWGMPTAQADDTEALRRFFTLMPEDLALIATVRGDAHRLALALILVWARTERILVADPTTLPEPVIGFVSTQLGLTPEVLAGYQSWPTTRAADAATIREHLQLRTFGAEDAERLRLFLHAKVSHTGNTAALLDAAEDWLFREGLLRPSGETTIERLIYQSRAQAEEELFARMTAPLSPEQHSQLDRLCQTDQGDSLLSVLAAPPRVASSQAIRDECHRLQQIRATLPPSLDWGPITPNRRRQWAATVRRHYAQALRRYPPAKRYTLLLAFLSVQAEETTDAIVEMLDTLVGRVFTRSDRDLQEVRVEQAKAISSSAQYFPVVAQVLLDPTIPPERVRDEIFRRVPREQISTLLEKSTALTQSQAKALFTVLDNRFPYVREFTPLVLETLEFGSPRADNELLEALAILRRMNAEQRRKVPEEAPIGFIPKRWAKAAQRPDGVDRHAWEFCLLSEVRAALRAGDLTVAGSRRYTPWDTDLYTPEAWQKRRASWFKESGLPEDGVAYVAQAAQDLHVHTGEVARRLPSNMDARVEQGKLRLTALERVEVPEEVLSARRNLTALLPPVHLPQLLMEVDRWTGFSADLFHLTTRRAPTAHHMASMRPALFAVLVAEATNIGLATMARGSGIPYGQLVRVYDWHFREETLRQAITRLIHYHRTLPLTQRFGCGTTSSSDGVRFGVAAAALNARHHPRYFGMRRGVTVYGHVSDQGSQFWINVVNCLLRESTYVLDGLVYQDALPIREHYTDTHGYTDLIFGLFELLGYRFAPRLRDLPDQVLYRVNKDADYGPLDPVVRNAVHTDLIARYWEDLNRLAASLKDGRVLPSLIVSKLQAMRRHNPLQRAIVEVGRIGKTRHILSYADDPRFRRRILVGLNKGESLHSMARIIFFGRQGRFGDRGYEDQLNRASALSLVINAIVVWNTRYLEAAAAELAHRRQPVPDRIWQHLSPILWEHVHLVGRYSFDEPVIDGELRPLQTEEG